MDDGPTQPASERDRARDHLTDLVETRKRVEQRRQDLTEQIHQAMRAAHEAGWSWSDIAGFAEYRTAATARSQATPRSDRPPPQHPPDTYSVREAARRLGVSAPTVYAWIESGRLELAPGDGRNKRVVLPARQASDDEPQ